MIPLYLHHWVESTRTRKMALFYPELIRTHEVLGIRTSETLEGGTLRGDGCELWPRPSREGGGRGTP